MVYKRLPRLQRNGLLGNCATACVFDLLNKVSTFVATKIQPLKMIA